MPKNNESIITCKNCGKEFNSKSKIQAHCSKECRVKWKNRNAIRKPVASVVYTCKYCGKEYHPKQSDRKTYCSRECHYADIKTKPKVKVKKIITCVVCGKGFEGKTNSKYCSKECYKIYSHNEYLKYKATEQYQMDLGRQRENYIPTQPLITKTCAYCGERFQTRNSRQIRCSSICAEKHHKLMHKGNVSRARRNRVFKRDDYRCKLCGKKMRMDKQDTLGTKQPHLLAPTIDHIVPVSIAKQMGWTNVMIHKESNLQSAHLICNIKKSNGAMNEQLRIW